MAMSGHRNSQSPQLMHSSGLTQQAFCSSSKSKTFFGQNATQMLQPLHHSLLIFTFFFASTQQPQPTLSILLVHNYLAWVTLLIFLW
jgi:hypothetical protein